MRGIRFTENIQAVPLLAPISVASSAASNYVDMNLSHWVSFGVFMGAMTSDSTDTITITIEASTAGTSNATEAAVPFLYRKATVGTDAFGAITSATSAGLAITATDDNTYYLIEIDPVDLNSNPGADFRYLRVVLTAGAGLDTAVGAVTAFLEPRYKEDVNQSSS